VAKHSINLGNFIQFQDTSILAKKSQHLECINKEMKEIDLHPDNMNREEDFSLSKSWKPLLQALEE